MTERDFCLHFGEEIKKPLQKGVPLSTFSTFKIGGKADYFFEATMVQELKQSVSIARQHSFPFYLIAAGSNLLFDDAGFRGLIIRNSVQGIRVRKDSSVAVLAGTLVTTLIQFCQEYGLSGAEFLAGIPGSVGGAVYGNAGAFGQSIGDVIKEAVVLGEMGEEMAVERDFFRFGYRQSSLKEKHHILLQAVIACQEGDKVKIKKAVEENLRARWGKHPPEGTACAGSYFKNPVLPDRTKVAAGKLLEQAGAKGMSVGEASVYPHHANFIINRGRAKAKDVLDLARILKERVKEKHSVELEEEVIFLPATASML